MVRYRVWLGFDRSRVLKKCTCTIEPIPTVLHTCVIIKLTHAFTVSNSPTGSQTPPIHYFWQGHLRLTDQAASSLQAHEGVSLLAAFSFEVPVGIPTGPPSRSSTSFMKLAAFSALLTVRPVRLASGSFSDFLVELSAWVRRARHSSPSADIQFLIPAILPRKRESSLRRVWRARSGMVEFLRLIWASLRRRLPSDKVGSPACLDKHQLRLYGKVDYWLNKDLAGDVCPLCSHCTTPALGIPKAQCLLKIAKLSKPFLSFHLTPIPLFCLPPVCLETMSQLLAGWLSIWWNTSKSEIKNCLIKHLGYVDCCVVDCCPWKAPFPLDRLLYVCINLWYQVIGWDMMHRMRGFCDCLLWLLY